MSRLTVPVVAVILGEGNSGGALALAVADRVLMLEHSVYAILSPEGFASILWKDAGRSQEAAGLMKLTAPELLRLGVIDEVILEPVGGAIWLPPLRTGRWTRRCSGTCPLSAGSGEAPWLPPGMKNLGAWGAVQPERPGETARKEEP